MLGAATCIASPIGAGNALEVRLVKGPASQATPAGSDEQSGRSNRRFFDVDLAPACRIDRAFDDLAGRRRLELLAIVAAQLALRRFLVRNRLLRRLGRSRVGAVDGHARAEEGRAASSGRQAPQQGAPRNF